MTLPVSGLISLANVNVELGRASTAAVSLAESAVRTLAGVASGIVYLSNLHGKSSYTPMVGTGYDAYVTDYATGTAYTESAYPYVTVVNGTGGYTYSWTFINQNGFSIVNPTSSNPTVRHSITKFGYSGSCTLQCVITDNTAHSITVSPITVTMEILDPAAP